MNRLTREWVQKAEEDWLSASSLTETASSRRRPLHDSICFHCQQSAEKYLKALLQELGLVVPRTHDLEDLHDLLLARDPRLAGLRRACSILTPYAVDYRYPGTRARKRQAQAAVRHVEKVRAVVRNCLGLAV
jgi:HEPN domain-containing protein